MAQLDVTVLATGKRKFIHFIRYDGWIGELDPVQARIQRAEIHPFFSQIPSGTSSFRGDEKWMKKVLFENRRLFTVMICGENRLDLKTMVMYDMTDHNGTS